MATITDPYPSRHLDQPQFIERVDPVIYNEHAEGPLSRAELLSYQSDGFLILDDWLTIDTLHDLRSEMAAMIRDHAIKSREETILEPESQAVRSIFAIHKLSNVFRRVAASEQMAGVARQILDGDVTVHQSRLNLKPGFAGKPFPWHSDFETWHIEDGMPRMRALSMSICLTDNFAHNGPLMLIPGSQNKFISCVGQTPGDHYKQSLKKQAYGVPDNDSLAMLCDSGGVVQATPRAGSVIVFDCNTMHGSAGNMTPYPRSNAFFVFNHVANGLVEPFCDQPPRPDYIADRDPKPISQW